VKPSLDAGVDRGRRRLLCHPVRPAYTGADRAGEGMFADRLARLARALADHQADAYLSASPVDLRYFTGCAEPAGFLLAQPGRPPRLLVRLSAARHAAETAPAAEVVPYALTETPEARLAALLREGGLRLVAWDGLSARTLLALQAARPEVLFLPAPDLSPRLRRRKEPAEVACLRQAARIAAGSSVAAARLRT